MSSDKDDVKAPGEEPVADVLADTTAGDDDPSLTDEDMPVVTDEALAEAEEKLAQESPEAAGYPDTESGAPNVSDDDTDDPGASGEDNDDEDEEEEEGEGGQMSLLDHLGELRVRLTRIVIAIIIGMLACYYYSEQMFHILMDPMVEVFQQKMAENAVLPAGFYVELKKSLMQLLPQTGFQHPEQIDVFVDALQKALSQVVQEGHFQYTYPAEAFFSYIKISIVAGIFLMSPFIFSQIWGFIAPGLYTHERKWMIPMALASAAFFIGGAVFGYTQVMPIGFKFFAGFATEGIQFTPKLNEYLSFCLKLLFAFGLVFELPLFIFFLARLGMVSSAGLRKKRKYAILVGFVVAAILTPPDPATQCLMAGPMIILYEVGIWVAYFFGKKEKRHLKKQAEEEAAAQAEMDEAAAQAEEADKA